MNEAISDADFEMVVYGPCENPEILIGSHKYHVNCQLETGEYLVINSLSKKIYKVKNDGEQVNQYNLQDRDWYVFQKVASGSHSVSWSGLSDQMKTILSAPWQFPIIAAVSVIIWQCRM